MTYPSGRVLTLSYTQGRVTAMSLAANSSATAVPLISGVQYFPFGAPESWLLGSSTSSKDYTRLIDASSRITAINDYLGTSTTPNATQTHTYDNAGPITSFTGYTSNGVNPSTGAGNASITQTQSFTYDNNGNRLTSVLNGTTSSYAIQGTSNRLLSVSSSMGGMSKTNTFDASGNLVSDDTTRVVRKIRASDRTWEGKSHQGS